MTRDEQLQLGLQAAGKFKAYACPAGFQSGDAILLPVRAVRSGPAVRRSGPASRTPKLPNPAHSQCRRPDPPQTGDLDIQQVLESPYFFA